MQYFFKITPLCVLPLLITVGAVCAQTTDTNAPSIGKINFSLGLIQTNNTLVKGVTIQSKTGLLLDANYEKGPWVASMQNGLGFKLINGKTFSLGLSANYMPGRYVANDTRYAGMGDVTGTLSAYSWAQWKPFKDALTVYGNVAHSARSSSGILANAGTTLGFPVMGKLNGFVDVNLTWGSAAYNQSYYGVSSAQSGSSLYAIYNAPGGRISTTPSVGLVYEADKQWSIVGYLGKNLLAPAAANSPMATNKTSQPQAALLSTWSY